MFTCCHQRVNGDTDHLEGSTPIISRDPHQSSRGIHTDHLEGSTWVYQTTVHSHVSSTIDGHGGVFMARRWQQTTARKINDDECMEWLDDQVEDE
jgi:hypothetical protein